VVSSPPPNLESQREADSDTKGWKGQEVFPSPFFPSTRLGHQPSGFKEGVVPTALRIGPYRFFFYSNEGNEPAHIHVQRDRALAKFWLTSPALASSSGFSAQELARIWRLVEQNAGNLKEAWNEFFSDSNRASR